MLKPIKILILSLIFLNLTLPLSAAERFRYDDQGNRDPFSPLVTPDGRILPGAKSNVEEENLVLEGVMWDANGNSMAIINGKLIKEKERIYDMQVLSIKKESVVVQKKGKVMVLQLIRKGGTGNE